MVGKRLAQNVFVFVLAVFACLVALEGTVRIMAPQRFEASYPAVYESHPRLGHVMRPNASGVYRTGEFEVVIRTNADGFRGPHYGPKRASTFRVVELGDSFTLGAEVAEEDTYGAVLDRMLNVRPGGRQYEVLNLGIRAYGTEQELQLLREAGLRYQPDLVILQVYASNDLYENHPRLFTYTIADGFVIPTPAQDPEPDTSATTMAQQTGIAHQTAEVAPTEMADHRLPIPFKAWLAEYSHLYLLLRTRYHLLWLRMQNRSEYKALESKNVKMASEWVSWMESAAWVYRRVYDDGQNARWAVVDSLMNDLAVLSARHQFKVVLMNAPLRERLGSDVFQAWGLDPRLYDPFKPDTMLEAIARRHGFTSVALYPEFALAAQGDERLYWTVDGHWTPAGHRLVARALYNTLIRYDLVPR
ncbi:MAG: hypothetical protein HY710_07040 [Candidatus Latescibacteria bacterium]|nr:hypothetical protein [Candidatus Latescibacterota bacterium]